jgi:hypothetical protein
MKKQSFRFRDCHFFCRIIKFNFEIRYWCFLNVWLFIHTMYMIKIFYKFLFYNHELSVTMDIVYGIVDLYSDLSPITFSPQNNGTHIRTKSIFTTNYCGL